VRSIAATIPAGDHFPETGSAVGHGIRESRAARHLASPLMAYEPLDEESFRNI
jgi:hypothetical protein